MNRCKWVNLNHPNTVVYHDTEWGKEVHDDRQLFELLILEGFQAGLSWECILNKRTAFFEVYRGFDPEIVSRFQEDWIETALLDRRIVRNRSKLRASIQNAIVFRNIQAEFGSFDAYIWKFVDRTANMEPYTLRTSSPLSDAVSSDLKRRGMQYVGTTIVYSYLQAIGVLNGHSEDCCYRFDHPCKQKHP